MMRILSRPFVAAVSFVFSLTQAVPLGFAQGYLRGQVAAESLGVDLRSAGWQYGPAGENFERLGAFNLGLLGQRIGEAAQADAAAIALGRPVDSQLADYAARYAAFHGQALSPEALAQRSRQIAVSKEAANAVLTEAGLNGQVEVVLAINDDGGSLLLGNGVANTPAHAGLAIYGHQQPVRVFMDLDQTYRLADPATQDGRVTLRKTLLHLAADARLGYHKPEAPEEEKSIQGVVDAVARAIAAENAAFYAQNRTARQMVARRRAEEAQTQPRTVIHRVSGVPADLAGNLREAVSALVPAQLDAVDVKEQEGTVIITATTHGPETPLTDRILTDAVEAAVAAVRTQQGSTVPVLSKAKWEMVYKAFKPLNFPWPAGARAIMNETQAVDLREDLLADRQPYRTFAVMVDPEDNQRAVIGSVPFDVFLADYNAFLADYIVLLTLERDPIGKLLTLEPPFFARTIAVQLMQDPKELEDIQAAIEQELSILTAGFLLPVFGESFLVDVRIVKGWEEKEKDSYTLGELARLPLPSQKGAVRSSSVLPQVVAAGALALAGAATQVQAQPIASEIIAPIITTVTPTTPDVARSASVHEIYQFLLHEIKQARAKDQIGPDNEGHLMRALKKDYDALDKNSFGEKAFESVNRFKNKARERLAAHRRFYLNPPDLASDKAHPAPLEIMLSGEVALRYSSRVRQYLIKTIDQAYSDGRISNTDALELKKDVRQSLTGSEFNPLKADTLTIGSARNIWDTTERLRLRVREKLAQKGAAEVRRQRKVFSLIGKILSEIPVGSVLGQDKDFTRALDILESVYQNEKLGPDAIDPLAEALKTDKADALKYLVRTVVLRELQEFQIKPGDSAGREAVLGRVRAEFLHFDTRQEDESFLDWQVASQLYTVLSKAEWEQVHKGFTFRWSSSDEVDHAQASAFMNQNPSSSRFAIIVHPKDAKRARIGVMPVDYLKRQYATQLTIVRDSKGSPVLLTFNPPDFARSFADQFLNEGLTRAGNVQTAIEEESYILTARFLLPIFGDSMMVSAQNPNAPPRNITYILGEMARRPLPSQKGAVDAPALTEESLQKVKDVIGSIQALKDSRAAIRLDREKGRLSLSAPLGTEIEKNIRALFSLENKLVHGATSGRLESVFSLNQTDAEALEPLILDPQTSQQGSVVVRQAIKAFLENVTQVWVNASSPQDRQELIRDPQAVHENALRAAGKLRGISQPQVQQVLDRLTAAVLQYLNSYGISYMRDFIQRFEQDRDWWRMPDDELVKVVEQAERILSGAHDGPEAAAEPGFKAAGRLTAQQVQAFAGLMERAIKEDPRIEFQQVDFSGGGSIHVEGRFREKLIGDLDDFVNGLPAPIETIASVNKGPDGAYGLNLKLMREEFKTLRPYAQLGTSQASRTDRQAQEDNRSLLSQVLQRLNTDLKAVQGEHAGKVGIRLEPISPSGGHMVIRAPDADSYPGRIQVIRTLLERVDFRIAPETPAEKGFLVLEFYPDRDFYQQIARLLQAGAVEQATEDEDLVSLYYDALPSEWRAKLDPIVARMKERYAVDNERMLKDVVAHIAVGWVVPEEEQSRLRSVLGEKLRIDDAAYFAQQIRDAKVIWTDQDKMVATALGSATEKIQAAAEPLIRRIEQRGAINQRTIDQFLLEYTHRLMTLWALAAPEERQDFQKQPSTLQIATLRKLDREELITQAQVFDILLPLTAAVQAVLARYDNKALAAVLDALRDMSPGEKVRLARQSDLVFLEVQAIGKLGSNVVITPEMRESLWVGAHAFVHGLLDMNDPDLRRVKQEVTSRFLSQYGTIHASTQRFSISQLQRLQDVLLNLRNLDIRFQARRAVAFKDAAPSAADGAMAITSIASPAVPSSVLAGHFNALAEARGSVPGIKGGKVEIEGDRVTYRLEELTAEDVAALRDAAQVGAALTPVQAEVVGNIKSLSELEDVVIEGDPVGRHIKIVLGFKLDPNEQRPWFRLVDLARAHPEGLVYKPLENRVTGFTFSELWFPPVWEALVAEGVVKDQLGAHQATPGTLSPSPSHKGQLSEIFVQTVHRLQAAKKPSIKVELIPYGLGGELRLSGPANLKTQARLLQIARQTALVRPVTESMERLLANQPVIRERGKRKEYQLSFLLSQVDFERLSSQQGTADQPAFTPPLFYRLFREELRLRNAGFDIGIHLNSTISPGAARGVYLTYLSPLHDRMRPTVLVHLAKFKVDSLDTPSDVAAIAAGIALSSIEPSGNFEKAAGSNSRQVLMDAARAVYRKAAQQGAAEDSLWSLEQHDLLREVLKREMGDALTVSIIGDRDISSSTVASIQYVQRVDDKSKPGVVIRVAPGRHDASAILKAVRNSPIAPSADFREQVGERFEKAINGLFVIVNNMAQGRLSPSLLLRFRMLVQPYWLAKDNRKALEAVLLPEFITYYGGQQEPVVWISGPATDETLADIKALIGEAQKAGMPPDANETRLDSAVVTALFPVNSKELDIFADLADERASAYSPRIRGRLPSAFLQTVLSFIQQIRGQAGQGAEVQFVPEELLVGGGRLILKGPNDGSMGEKLPKFLKWMDDHLSIKATPEVFIGVGNRRTVRSITIQLNTVQFEQILAAYQKGNAVLLAIITESDENGGMTVQALLNRWWDSGDPLVVKEILEKYGNNNVSLREGVRIGADFAGRAIPLSNFTLLRAGYVVTAMLPGIRKLDQEGSAGRLSEEEGVILDLVGEVARIVYNAAAAGETGIGIEVTPPPVREKPGTIKITRPARTLARQRLQELAVLAEKIGLEAQIDKEKLEGDRFVSYLYPTGNLYQRLSLMIALVKEQEAAAAQIGLVSAKTQAAKLLDQVKPFVQFSIDDAGNDRLRVIGQHRVLRKVLLGQPSDDPAAAWLQRELSSQMALTPSMPDYHYPPLELAKAIAQETATFASNPPAEMIPTVARPMTNAVAVTSHSRGHIGRAKDPKNKKEVDAGGKIGDGDAKRVIELMAAILGVKILMRGPEGIGRDSLGEDDAFNVAEQVNDRARGPAISGLVDPWEVTKGGSTNNFGVARKDLSPSATGTTSLFVQGPVEDSLGNISDNAYMDGLFFHVPANNWLNRLDVFLNGALSGLPKLFHPLVRLLRRLLDIINPPIRPDTEDYKTIRRVLKRIARINRVTVNELDIDVLDRPRERKRVQVFKQIKQEYPGLGLAFGDRDGSYADGTVAHHLLASIGRKNGKRVKVSWTVGAPIETAANSKMIKALRSFGARGSMVVYSKNVAKTPKGGEAEQGEAADLSNRNAFDAREEKDWIEYQGPERAKWILRDHKLWTDRDITDDVYVSFPLLTDSAVLGLPGVRHLGDGVYRVTSVNIQQVGNEPPYIWVDVEDLSAPEFERQLARAKFALQDPGVPLSVSDPNGNLLALMEDFENPREARVYESVFAQSPALAIVWEQAIEAFAQRQGITREEAGERSAFKLIVESPNVGSGALAQTYAARFFERMSQASGNAVSPALPGISFRSGPSDGTTALMGPQDWIEEILARRPKDAAQLPVVLYNPVNDPGEQFRSPADGFHALVAALRADQRRPSAEMASRLNVSTDENFSSPNILRFIVKHPLKTDPDEKYHYTRKAYLDYQQGMRGEQEGASRNVTNEELTQHVRRLTQLIREGKLTNQEAIGFIQRQAALQQVPAERLDAAVEQLRAVKKDPEAVRKAASEDRLLLDTDVSRYSANEREGFPSMPKDKSTRQRGSAESQVYAFLNRFSETVAAVRAAKGGGVSFSDFVDGRASLVLRIPTEAQPFDQLAHLRTTSQQMSLGARLHITKEVTTLTLTVYNYEQFRILSSLGRQSETVIAVTPEHAQVFSVAMQQEQKGAAQVGRFRSVLVTILEDVFRRLPNLPGAHTVSITGGQMTIELSPPSDALPPDTLPSVADLVREREQTVSTDDAPEAVLGDLAVLVDWSQRDGIDGRMDRPDSGNPAKVRFIWESLQQDEEDAFSKLWQKYQKGSVAFNPVQKPVISADNPGRLAQAGFYSPTVVGNYSVTPTTAARFATAQAPVWVVIHSSVLLTPEVGIEAERIREQLGQIMQGGSHGWRLALAVDQTINVQEAEQRGKALIQAASSASQQLGYASMQEYDAIVPATDELAGLLTAASPGSSLGAVVGPEDFSRRLRSQEKGVRAVIVNPSVSGIVAIDAGVESAAANGRFKPPASLGRLEIFADDLFIPKKIEDRRREEERSRYQAAFELNMQSAAGAN